jgi:GNAT superfamily N-acetyltransferase
MELSKILSNTEVIRFSYFGGDIEVGRARLVFVPNDLHSRPYGLLEDVFVHPNYREQGIATKLTTNIIQEARRRGCHKLICTSRFGKDKVHELYESMGFRKHGFEFRIDLNK